MNFEIRPRFNTSTNMHDSNLISLSGKLLTHDNRTSFSQNPFFPFAKPSLALRSESEKKKISRQILRRVYAWTWPSHCIYDTSAAVGYEIRDVSGTFKEKKKFPRVCSEVIFPKARGRFSSDKLVDGIRCSQFPIPGNARPVEFRTRIHSKWERNVSDW